jgi:hypothetical protein
MADVNKVVGMVNGRDNSRLGISINNNKRYSSKTGEKKKMGSRRPSHQKDENDKETKFFKRKSSKDVQS